MFVVRLAGIGVLRVVQPVADAWIIVVPMTALDQGKGVALGAVAFESRDSDCDRLVTDSETDRTLGLEVMESRNPLDGGRGEETQRVAVGRSEFLANALDPAIELVFEQRRASRRRRARHGHRSYSSRGPVASRS